MKFTKQGIIDFKQKGRSYVTWRKLLKRGSIKYFFYNSDRRLSIKVLFPGRNLEYCECNMYHIVLGDYQLGLKYVNDSGTYYMFLAANSCDAPPQNIAIGKAVDGKIYLICEQMPDTGYTLNFREIPEEYINRNEKGFRPRSYDHSIFIGHASNQEENVQMISDEDVKCLKIAYEGVRAFSRLIGEAREIEYI